MDITVTVTAGQFAYEVTVTDTGPDGIREAQDSAIAHALALVGAQALAHAAATPVEDD